MISFANSVGSLFNVWGKCGLTVKAAKTYQTAQQPNLVDVANGLVAQLDANSDVQALVGNSWTSVLNSATQAGQLAAQVAAAYANRVVFLDNPQPGQTFTNGVLSTSLTEIIRQMKVAGASILAMTIGATPSAFTGTGNGVVRASAKRPLDGLVLENAFAETILLRCTSDSYSGSAIAGNESFIAAGQGQAQSPFVYNWPAGSGASTNLSAINGDANNSQGNLLANSGFSSWTLTNTPNNYAVNVGTPGTNIFQESSIVYGGGSALRLLGDGATLLNLSQAFGSSSLGTGGTLSPLTQYAFNLFARRDGVAVGAGTLTVDLIDGNGAVIADAAGVANSFTVDLTALTTNYAASGGIFRTPAIMPSAYSWRFRTTTPISNGRSVYLDKMALGQTTQMGPSQIFLAVFSGSVPYQIGDYATGITTNSRGAGGTLSTFQTCLAQFFPNEVIGGELLFPSSASPTISDSVLIA